jgi:purine-binding chemotaxis protein CheW
MMDEKIGKEKKMKDTIKIKLPESGLAEDILGNMGKDLTATSNPERLFAFADSLEKQNAERESEEKTETKLETWVTFLLDSEDFGLPVSHVLEILRVSGITRVPHAPHPVRGVTNLRGRVLPVVDLRVRLGLQEKDLDVRSRILVVSSAGRLMGLLVDAVYQVVRIDRNNIQPPPPDIMTEQSDYILGVYHLQARIAILLDVDRVLLIHDSLQQPEKISASGIPCLEGNRIKEGNERRKS